MIDFILVLLTIFTIYYFSFIKRVHSGLLKLSTSPPAKTSPSVDVIIAARNEEKSIGACLESLVNQNYPSNKYEIIVVDDASTDSTASIVRLFAEKYSNVRLISTEEKNNIGTGSKPTAISKGINNSSGEIILTTDADCFVPPQWIQILINHFEENVALVAGPVAEQYSDSFFSQLERLEFLGLITTAAGLIGSGRPIICNGANLAYRRSAFNEIKGFEGNASSNDDESLMNRIFCRNIGKIVFAPESDAVVMTHSSNTISSFLKQRVRWANKRGHYEDKSILISLVSVYFFFLTFFITALLIPLRPWFLLPIFIAFTIKVSIEYLTIKSGARLFGQCVPTFYFLIAELLHVPYIVIAAAIGQISSMHWKGRIIKQ